VDLEVRRSGDDQPGSDGGTYVDGATQNKSAIGPQVTMIALAS